MRKYILMIFAVLSLSTCVHEPFTIAPTANMGGFPREIGEIITNRCAIEGCHNAASYQNAAGLLLSSWANLFSGGGSGAVVVPFNSRNSSLLYTVNTDNARGIVTSPTMPLNLPPLSEEEYNLVKRWIENGAPDSAGVVAFSSKANTRQKLYLTQQGCDLIAVIDCEKNLVMRYIPVGMSNGIEAPHYIRVSPDGRYAYVSFINGLHIQKIDTYTDTVVSTVQIGQGSWNVFHLSPDGKQIVVGNWQSNGGVLFIDTETMKIVSREPNAFNFPHGIASNVTFDTFFITAQYGNVVYKYAPSGFLKQISIDSQPTVLSPNKRDPHMILMHPDYSKYFLTCQASNEIRVMDVYGDTVLKAIPVGIHPQEMTLSTSKPYLFITCTEDNSSLAGYKGSVYVINYNTLEVIKRIDGEFFQPHAISVDERNGLVYIASRNFSPNGPAPHHSSSCSGRNGYYNVYDLNTLQPAFTNKRYEVSVEPYSSDIRFKE